MTTNNNGSSEHLFMPIYYMPGMDVNASHLLTRSVLPTVL